jgi:Spy/CpxP family protein refolding chaperone
MRNKFLMFLATGALGAGMALAQAPAANTAPSGQSNATQRAHRDFLQQRLVRLTRQLNLTDAQHAQAKTIFTQARDTAKPVRQQMRENRMALRAAVKADNTSQIQQLATARGTLMGKMAAIYSDAAANFYQDLTPAQRAKADQLHQQFRERGHERFNQRNAG